MSAFGPAPAGSGGGPAAALGTPAGRGCGWGGEAAPRGPRRPGDWAREEAGRRGEEIRIEI